MAMGTSVQKISNDSNSNEVHTGSGNTKSAAIPVMCVEQIQEQREEGDRSARESFGSQLKVAELA